VDGLGMPKRPGRATAVAGAHAARCPALIRRNTVAKNPPIYDFKTIFSKLLPKTCSNLKNSQDMKSLELKALQVCFCDQTQILNNFCNLDLNSKGDKSRVSVNSKLLQIF
jgi:hypothetical protein